MAVNPRWPWLGESPDAHILDEKEKSMYGAMEVKCPESKSVMSITEECRDKSFCLKLVNRKVCLQKKRVYYYQSQGVMAICKFRW